MPGTTDFFNADRPILSSGQDLLGRSHFAEQLADAINNWRGNESITIALYGRWGSGKSSVKNIIIEQLSTDKDRCPYILEFNPWQWVNQDQLSLAFFDELSITIQRSNRSKENREAAKSLKAYQAKLALGANLFGQVRRALTLTSLLNDPGMLEPAEQLKQLETGLSEAQKALGQGVEASEAQAKSHERTLHELKKDISDALRNLSRPTLVVIDDIDRLTRQEIRLLFQLIKANADFPNTIYLVLFQRDIVEKALTDNEYTGREYLEKIIQIGFDIPQVEKTKLESIFFDHLSRALTAEAQVRFSKDRWSILYLNGIRYYIEDLRDVYRYVSTFAFHASMFSRNGSFDVNPVDLMALETLRVFEPALYSALPEAKVVLTGRAASSYPQKNSDDERNRAIDDLLNKSQNRAAAYSILKELFPSINNASTDKDEWLRSVRICHSQTFDRYFHLAIPTGDIPQAEIDAVLDSVDNRAALVRIFDMHHKKSTLTQLVKYLEAYKTCIYIQGSESFATALFDIGDILAEYESDMFERPTDYARVTILWYVEAGNSYKKRIDLLKKSIARTTGLFLPVNYVSAQERVNKETERHRVEEVDLKAFQSLCLAKIKAAASSDSLDGHPRLLYILYRWAEWGSRRDVSKWVAAYIQTKKGFLHLTQGLLRPDMWSDKRRIDREDLEALISITAFSRAMKNLALDVSIPEESEAFDAVNALKAATKRSRKRSSEKEEDDEED